MSFCKTCSLVWSEKGGMRSKVEWEEERKVRRTKQTELAGRRRRSNNGLPRGKSTSWTGMLSYPARSAYSRFPTLASRVQININ